MSGTNKIPKKKAATFNYVARELKDESEFIEYINSNAICPAKFKGGYRRYDNVEEIYPWIRFDVDVEGEAELLEERIKDYYYIKKPSTNNDKDNYKWHYHVAATGMHKTDVSKFNWQSLRFCEDHGIKLHDMRTTKVCVQNLNPYMSGKKLKKAVQLTKINKGQIYKAVEAPTNVSFFGTKDVQYSGKSLNAKPMGAVVIVNKHRSLKILGVEGYIKNIKGGWIKLEDLRISEGERLGGLSCPVCNTNHTANPDETPYSFAYRNGLDTFIKCTGAACNEYIYMIERTRKLESLVTSFVNEDKIEAYLRNTGYNPKTGKFTWISSSGNIRQFIKTEVSIFFKDLSTDRILTSEENTLAFDVLKNQYGCETVDEYYKLVQHQMISWLMFHNQYDSMSFTVNAFGPNEVSFDKNQMVVKLNKILPREVPLVENSLVVNDYKKHFPNFDKFIDLILASRFGADKKECYLWMKCESNWGKSMLFENLLMGRMGLVTLLKEKELKKAMSGDPVGVNGNDFIYSWILLFEEFRGAVSELKDISHNLSFAPKGSARVTVDLYLKAFLSAEQVNSLEGDHGVEKQFANRFMKMELGGSLVERTLYKSDQEYYKSVLASYIYRRFLKGIEHYLSVGEIESSREAQKILSDFRSDHLMKSGDLLEGISEVRENFFNNVIRDLDFGGSEKYSDVFFVTEDVLYTTNKGKAAEMFIIESFARKDQNKMQHKTNNELLGLLNNSRVHTSKGNRQIWGHALTL